jgi:hypothetical protein
MLLGPSPLHSKKRATGLAVLSDGSKSRVVLLKVSSQPNHPFRISLLSDLPTAVDGRHAALSRCLAHHDSQARWPPVGARASWATDPLPPFALDARSKLRAEFLGG